MKQSIRAVLAAVTLAGLSAGAVAESALTLTVHTGHGFNGYDVNSTMVSGEKDMILIDAQFSLSEAHRLAAEIIESKKNLTTIYITHPHPDHMFGLAVLKQAFPAARVLALSQTAAAMKTGWPNRQKFWFPTYGNNIPGPDPVLPEELTVPYLELEGQQFPVFGPTAGSDGPGNTFVHIPSLKAVVTGDIVFDHVYFGVQKDKAREDWSHSIDQILALKPEIIVPGHEGPKATRNPASIAFMKKYIADWDVAVSRSKDAADMKQRWLKSHPGLGMAFTIDARIAPYFPAPEQKK